MEVYGSQGVHLNPLNKVYHSPWLRHQSPSLTGTLPKMACRWNIAQNFFVVSLINHV